MEEMMTCSEAAKLLRVKVETVRAWVKSGKLRASRPGRRLLVPRAEVDRLLAGA